MSKQEFELQDIKTQIGQVQSGMRSVQVLGKMIERDPRAPLQTLYAEMMAVRPASAILAQAAEDDPLGYVRALKQVAEPLIPKEIQTVSAHIDASAVLAELMRRGIVDAGTAQRMGAAVGATIEGSVPDVHTGPRASSTVCVQEAGASSDSEQE